MILKVLTIAVALLAPVYCGSIADSLMEKLSSQGKADAILELPSIMGTVLSNPLMKFMSGGAKTNFMTGLMQQMTTVAQAPFMGVLRNLGVESVESFWASNIISMKGVNMPIINAIQAASPFTAFKLREPMQVKLIQSSSNGTFGVKADAPQWGVQKIGAPTVWSKYGTGNGILVANIDTGVNVKHEALRDNYAGQWLDAVSGKTTPWDDDGHGTHTMGTICGTTKGIGVAPGARWVACRGLSSSGGSEQALTKCAQWILKLKEKPVVVSNSWGGRGGSTFFNDQIKAWQNAGIIPVFAIGNEGPKCSTTGSPGDQPLVISVGATTSTDAMASFSSRGPNNKGVLKPELSAPGQQIYSAWIGSGTNEATAYNTISGTSMATPHVAGAVALMKAVNPNLTFDDILKKLQSTAAQPSVASNDLKCGNVKTQYPNNAYGYGRINVANAIG